MLNPRISKDTQGRYWLEWTPDETAEGYAFTTPRGSSRTFNPNVAKVSLGTGLTEPFTATVSALDVLQRQGETAAYPALVPAPAPTPEPTPTGAIPAYGVCPGHSSQQWPDAKHTQAMQLCKALFQGKAWTWRVNSQGPNAAMDRDVYKVQAAGGTPYIICYSSQGPRTIDQLPTNLANRYKNTSPLPIFTGPNEPDLDRGSKVHWDPIPLARFQKQIYDQIKTVDPRYQVGSPAFWKTMQKTVDALGAYITAECQYGAHDFWAFHGYDDPAQRAQWWNIWGWWFPVPNGAVPAAKTMTQIAKLHGDTKPVVMDEGGCSMGAGENVQASRCVKLFQEAKNQNTVANSTVYSLFNNGDGFPIVNDDGTPRQAYTDLTKFIAGA